VESGSTLTRAVPLHDDDGRSFASKRIISDSEGLAGQMVRENPVATSTRRGAFRTGPRVYPVTFRYPGSAPATVALVGSFNHWDPHAHPLQFAEREWRITIYLPPGTYPYAFVIGGRSVRDPDPSRVLRGPLGAEYSVVNVVGDPSRELACQIFGEKCVSEQARTA
jgi:Glycogen recognition site of AMP-activated protein kinase